MLEKNVYHFLLPAFYSTPLKDPNQNPRTDQMICETPVKTCTGMKEFKT